MSTVSLMRGLGAAATVLIVVTSGAVSVMADDKGLEDRAAASRQAIKGFATRLKGELMSAMKSGGPSAAIEVCNVSAPAIAQEISEKTGWSVGRTALKLRNRSNAPDAWERAVLEEFLASAEKGADMGKLERFEVVSKDGGQVFRYMKAIPTGKPCLTCHGGAVDEALMKTIKQYYPQDGATGFTENSLRGAFSVIQKLD